MEFFVLNSFCNEQKKESRFFGLILFPIFYFFKKLGSGVLQGFSHAKPLFHKNQDYKIRINFSYFPIFHFCSSEFLFSGRYLRYQDFFVLNIKTELFQENGKKFTGQNGKYRLALVQSIRKSRNNSKVI